MYNKYNFDIRIQESNGEPYCRIVLDYKFSDTIRRLNSSRYSIKIDDFLDYYSSRRYNLKWYLYYDPLYNDYILLLGGSIISMLQFRYDYERIVNTIELDDTLTDLTNPYSIIANRNAYDLW